MHAFSCLGQFFTVGINTHTLQYTCFYKTLRAYMYMRVYAGDYFRL